MNTLIARIIVSIVSCIAFAAIACAAIMAQPACPVAPAIGAIADKCDRACVGADPANRYAIEADSGAGKTAAFLLVSRDCFNTGIESKALLSAEPEKSYFADAWKEAQRLFTPLPAWIGLAINAGNQDSSGKYLSRTQLRFHIHISCVRREVILELMRQRSALLALQPKPGTFTFQRLVSPLHPKPSAVTYAVYVVDGQHAQDPLSFLPREGNWKDYTAAFIGRSGGAEGFALIGHAAPGKAASAEDLLQQSCSMPAFGQ